MSLLGEAVMLGGSARRGKTEQSLACCRLLAEAEAGGSGRWLWTDSVPGLFAFPHPLSADLRLQERKLSGGKMDSEEKDGSVGLFSNPGSPEASWKQSAAAVKSSELSLGSRCRSEQAPIRTGLVFPQCLLPWQTATQRAKLIISESHPAV